MTDERSTGVTGHFIPMIGTEGGRTNTKHTFARQADIAGSTERLLELERNTCYIPTLGPVMIITIIITF
jgi:hypothetical protein